MTEAVQTADRTDEREEQSFRRSRKALNAYLSLGWFDRIGVASLIIMALAGGITLLWQTLGGMA